MIISGFTYIPYKLQLKKPFTNSKGTVSSRSGYLIEIRDFNGNSGIGDAAPLPEFGSEDMDTARKAILRFASEYPDEINEVNDITKSLQSYYVTPAARHGIEQALLNLMSAGKKETIPELLDRGINTEVKVNSLIGFVTPDQAANMASVMVKQGFDTIKIKAGRQDFQNDLDVVAAVRNNIGDKINLRIDANARWEYDEAVRNLRLLEKYNPEYVEQPVISKEDLIRLAFATDIKIAADESVRTIPELNRYIINKYAHVLIIKPMMIGSIIETADIIKKAAEYNIKTVISTSFESSVGFRSCLLLASFVKEDYAHGLSTLDFFTNDVYPNPFTIQLGKIKIEDGAAFSKI